MDKREPSRESAEVARESLISIAYSLPDKDISYKPTLENFTGEKAVDKEDHDEIEKYRSELISISDLQPSDGKIPPPTQKK